MGRAAPILEITGCTHMALPHAGPTASLFHVFDHLFSFVSVDSPGYLCSLSSGPLCSEDGRLVLIFLAVNGLNPHPLAFLSFMSSCQTPFISQNLFLIVQQGLFFQLSPSLPSARASGIFTLLSVIVMLSMNLAIVLLNTSFRTLALLHPEAPLVKFVN